MKRIGICAGVITMFFVPGYAQEQTLNSWLFLSHERGLSPKWSLLFDLQLRSSNRWQYLETVLFRPAVQYKFNKKNSVALGYAYLGNWEREDGDKTFDLEHRAWQQYQFERQWGKTEVINRLRLEQRFLQKNDGFDFSQRLRYYIRFELPLSPQVEEKPGPYLIVQNEIFLNVQNKGKINNSLFDQNRAYTGIGYRFSDKVDVEGGYLYRYQLKEEKVHNHILQVTVSTSF